MLLRRAAASRPRAPDARRQPALQPANPVRVRALAAKVAGKSVPTSAKQAVEEGLVAFNELKDYSEALRLFKAAMELKPSEQEAIAALYNAGCSHAKRKEWKEAAGCILDAVNGYNLKLSVALAVSGAAARAGSGSALVPAVCAARPVSAAHGAAPSIGAFPVGHALLGARGRHQSHAQALSQPRPHGLARGGLRSVASGARQSEPHTRPALPPLLAPHPGPRPRPILQPTPPPPGPARPLAFSNSPLPPHRPPRRRRAQDKDLRELRDTREWLDMMTQVKGGLTREQKINLRTEAKVRAGGDSGMGEGVCVWKEQGGGRGRRVEAPVARARGKVCMRVWSFGGGGAPCCGRSQWDCQPVLRGEARMWGGGGGGGGVAGKEGGGAGATGAGRLSVNLADRHKPTPRPTRPRRRPSALRAPTSLAAWRRARGWVW